MRFTFMLAAVLPLLLPLADPAMAALGGNEASIVADQVNMKATRRTFSAPEYTVHEIQTSSGTLIKEYISPQGQVFAVSWHGPFMPDLQQVLGSYFAEYSAAASNKRGGRGSLLVKQPGLVVRSGGHMRSFSGQAYIPKMVPPSVAIDEIN